MMTTFLFTVGCFSKGIVPTEMHLGPEVLLIDRQNGSSTSSSIALQSKLRPFGQGPYIPFFKSSVSIHDFEAIGNATNWYVDNARWDDSLSTAISLFIGIPYMTMVPFYGSKLSTGVGIDLPLAAQKGVPKIDIGTHVTSWLEPSHQEQPFMICMGIFSGLNWEIGRQTFAVQMSYDWPAWKPYPEPSMGIIGTGLTWGLRL